MQQQAGIKWKTGENNKDAPVWKFQANSHIKNNNLPNDQNKGLPDYSLC